MRLLAIGAVAYRGRAESGAVRDSKRNGSSHPKPKCSDQSAEYHSEYNNFS